LSRGACSPANGAAGASSSEALPKTDEPCSSKIGIEIEIGEGFDIAAVSDPDPDPDPDLDRACSCCIAKT
jgi:hypothetical protein